MTMVAILYYISIQERLELPTPSSSDAPLSDWLAELDPSRCIRVLLPVEFAGKPVRVNIVIEEGLLARIDRVAERRGRSRSAFLAEAARRTLAEGREAV